MNRNERDSAMRKLAIDAGHRLQCNKESGFVVAAYDDTTDSVWTYSRLTPGWSAGQVLSHLRRHVNTEIMEIEREEKRRAERTRNDG